MCCKHIRSQSRKDKKGSFVCMLEIRAEFASSDCIWPGQQDQGFQCRWQEWCNQTHKLHKYTKDPSSAPEWTLFVLAFMYINHPLCVLYLTWANTIFWCNYTKCLEILTWVKLCMVCYIRQWGGGINGFMYKAWIKKKLPSGINYTCDSLRLTQTWNNSLLHMGQTT